MNDKMSNQGVIRLALLDALAPGLTVTEIIEKTGISATSARAALNSLEGAGWVIANRESKSTKYALPSAVFDPDTQQSFNPAVVEAHRRDEIVLVELTERGPATVAELHDVLAKTGRLADVESPLRAVYGSVWRLHKAGRVKKVLAGGRSPVYALV